MNVDFSITRAYTGFIFCLISLHTHLEGTMSQLFYLGPSLYCMAKNGKHNGSLRYHTKHEHRKFEHSIFNIKLDIQVQNWNFGSIYYIYFEVLYQQ